MTSFRRLAVIVLLAASVFLEHARLTAADVPKSQFFTSGKVKLHFVSAGAGEPVVLIHGLYSSALINWQLTGVFAALAKDHRVIALDMPGHGRSDKPDDDEAYGLQIVEDVVGLLDQLKTTKAHIVGYSLGGMVAVKFLAKHPERSLSGTIGGMGWFREGSGLQKFWEQIPNHEDGAGTPTAFLRNVGKLAVTKDELKSITVPVRVLVGDHDPCRQLYVEPLRKVRADWPVLEILDAGHFTCIVKKPFRDEIVDWIGRCSKR